ncbi:hypothetical protein J1614_006661 [Plenodomus biglobosus]|nr:hypothetical protein J1614_006661 [Plenodomus biglobosus]
MPSTTKMSTAQTSADLADVHPKYCGRDCKMTPATNQELEAACRSLLDTAFIKGRFVKSMCFADTPVEEPGQTRRSTV